MNRSVARARRAARALAKRIDWADDRGTAGAEVLPIGLLILVVGTLMIMNLWAVIDMKMAVNAGAREGARVMAESDGIRDLGRAQAAATAAVQAHKGPGVTIGFPNPPASWRLCQPIGFTVESSVGLINLPFLGSAGGPITVSATHTEIVDPYRSRSAAFADGQEVDCG